MRALRTIALLSLQGALLGAEAKAVYRPLGAALQQGQQLTVTNDLRPYAFALGAASRSQRRCDARNLEIVFAVQPDFGMTKEEELPELAKQISDGLFDLGTSLSKHKGLNKGAVFKSVKYSLLSFDSSEAGLSDDCHVNYVHSNFTENILEIGASYYEVIKEHLENAPASGDLSAAANEPLNNFQAILAAVHRTQWSPDSTRLIVHVTDRAPRYYDDGLFKESKLQAPSGAVTPEACRSDYFPTPEQVVAALKSKGVYIVHLITDPLYFQGQAGAAWHMFNRLNDQPGFMVNAVADDATDLAEKTFSVLEYLLEAECGAAAEPRRLGAVSFTNPGGVQGEFEVAFPEGDLPPKLNIEYNGKELVPGAKPATIPPMPPVPAAVPRVLQTLDIPVPLPSPVPIVITQGSDLKVELGGRPQELSVKFNGVELAPPITPLRKLGGVEETAKLAVEPIVITRGNDVKVVLSQKPSGVFSVNYNGEDLTAGKRQLQAVDIVQGNDLKVSVGGRPAEFSVKFNGIELAPPAARRLQGVETPAPIVIEQGKDLKVVVGGRPAEFSVKYNGVELAPPATRRLQAVDAVAPIVIEHGNDLKVQVGGRPAAFSVKFNGVELAPPATRRLQAVADSAMPLVVEHGSDVKVEVGGRPTGEFSVKFNGEELVHATRRRLSETPLVIEHGRDLKVVAKDRPQQLSVKLNGEELAPAAARRMLAEKVEIEHGRDLKVEVGARPQEFSVKFNGVELTR